ncbi:C cytochromes biosynthesis protein [Granulicella sp. 5B5]|uniref:cytochrome c-type biogenesis protein n=1 Tax=Granulicella sp. 5B5 TaxID=1617967 RepID=UPI0015F6C688|nr:cytochrome c-type biogenesis protein CcmH [Granulicella sp. 5B5]QMV17618.1 C cytochromes biosynthesis protein [Granulicella sp. 5B5]
MLKRSIHILLLLTVAFSMLGAGSPDTRFRELGGKMMCTCGCAQMLLECNHVGCPDSPHLIAELHQQIAAGMTNAGILTWFADKYGPTVLAAPLRDNLFDRTTWYIPGAVLLLGILGVILLVRYWKSRQPAPIAPLPHTPSNDALRDRIRNETEY